MRTLTDDELAHVASDLESFRVERKRSLADKSRVEEAICAFAHDLPGSRLPGVVLIGVDDHGVPAGTPITDALLTPDAVPNVAGLLLLGHEPTTFVKGAYVQLLRINGVELADPVVDRKEVAGPLLRYQGLMPLAQDARRPMFNLRPGDGAIGAHAASVQRCRDDFEGLAARILTKLREDPGLATATPPSPL